MATRTTVPSEAKFVAAATKTPGVSTSQAKTAFAILSQAKNPKAKWIKSAIARPGAFAAAAKRAGKSVSEYATEMQHEGGRIGKQARLALTLEKFKKNPPTPAVEKLYYAALAADEAFGDALRAKYGSRAGDARYGKLDDPKLKKLAAAKIAADDRYRDAIAKQRSVLNTGKKKNSGDFSNSFTGLAWGAKVNTGSKASDYYMPLVASKSGFASRKEAEDWASQHSSDTGSIGPSAAKRFANIDAWIADQNKRGVRIKKNPKGKAAPIDGKKFRKNPPVMSVAHGSLRADIYRSGSEYAAMVPGEGPAGGFRTADSAAGYARSRLAAIAKASAKNPGVLGKLGKAAKKLLAKMGGKKNPEASSFDSYEIFHGIPATQTVEYRENVHVHEWMWAAGTLVSIDVELVRNGKKFKTTFFAPDPDKVDFEDAVMLCFNESDDPDLVGTQMYFRGGLQDLPIDMLIDQGWLTDDDVKDQMFVGHITKITYRTHKIFEDNGKKPIDFWHPTGEEHADGVLPMLCYRPLDPSMFVVGGRYKIAPKDLGLKASPGIVG